MFLQILCCLVTILQPYDNIFEKCVDTDLILDGKTFLNFNFTNILVKLFTFVMNVSSTSISALDKVLCIEPFADQQLNIDEILLLPSSVFKPSTSLSPGWFLTTRLYFCHLADLSLNGSVSTLTMLKPSQRLQCCRGGEKKSTYHI